MTKIRGIDEKSLVERLKNGDQIAFELLFHYYYPGLVMYSMQFIPDRAEAEEIVQDFFVTLWQKHHLLLASESVKSYFFVSVKNKSLNFLKHEKIEESYINRLNELSDNHLVYNPDIYLETELKDKINKAVGTLPPKCREVFIMSRFRGMKNEEIAQELQISKRTVETHISQALSILRNELKEYAGLLLLFGIIRL